MVTDQTYQLCGYIEYLRSPVGFVTPVFKNSKDQYCTQVSFSDHIIWEVLPDDYISAIRPSKAFKVREPQALIYGFKWSKTLIFANGEEMSSYLSRSFLPFSNEGRALAAGFIEDWRSLEPITNDKTGYRPFINIENTTLLNEQNIKRHWWVAAAAVMIATVLVGVHLITHNHRDITVIKGPEYVRLPDGSSVLLNAGGRLEFSASKNALSFREVSLSGEAYFDITPDPSTPFIVHTGQIQTTVLGTAFNVKADTRQKKIVVTVSRGKVSIANNEHTFDKVSPDEQLVINTNTQTFEKSNVDARAATEWTKKYLIIDAITVAEAYQLVGKRFGITIEIENPDIKSRRIFAKFLQNEPLENVLDVLSIPTRTSYTISNGVVRIKGGESYIPAPENK